MVYAKNYETVYICYSYAENNCGLFFSGTLQITQPARASLTSRDLYNMKCMPDEWDEWLSLPHCLLHLIAMPPQMTFITAEAELGSGTTLSLEAMVRADHLTRPSDVGTSLCVYIMCYWHVDV